ncbi:hypothetical protein [Zavarzinia sp. CC-PAN008]|uniref:hypothetical protein n=1 Tax=Zavarzinia sp. CC-PAN008 TaxID=3243332 RepID=UPI003F7473BE
MAFDRFLALIRSDRLRAVAQEWQRARGVRAMPAWDDLDQQALAPHASILWSWRQDPASGDVIGRTAGSTIREIHRGDLTGQRDVDFFRSRGSEALVHRQRRIFLEPHLYHGRGFVFAHVQRLGLGERIAMPLSDSRTRGDGILGATVYSVRPQDYSSALEPQAVTEVGTEVPLD